MAAFERVQSGIPEMDQALDNIRLGDNVVWRVSSLDEFHLFLDPYLEQAIRDRRRIIYVRFASHEPLTEGHPEIETVSIELSHRFENFSVEIHNLIAREGKDVFYVFDCLSELQTAWATDLMMGNFFRVTCPFLFELDTVAFFPIIRGRHSLAAISKILDTTQLFLDVYSDTETDPQITYVRPEKVWNRSSETMFLPHLYDRQSGAFRPLLDGVQVSRFYQVMNRFQRPGDEQSTDAWDRFFNFAKQMHENGMDIADACSRMCDIMMSRDEKMRRMIKKHFRPEDYFFVRSHMIGTGMIGGKACGMLLARKIIENRRPDLFRIMEPHDSHFIGSDVYYSYIVENGGWNLRVRQRTEEEYFSLAAAFAEFLLSGKFSRSMEKQFTHLLEYYGQDPIIVRSSSILEDGFGNAFAGKYESVFCANTGTLEERLAEFENAVRQVYASTMGLSALDYRKRRGLGDRDEQMALLVQRVSGSHYDQYYMPCAAGVGYSYSPYRFLKDLDPAAGMLRLVMGLGTSAVDRTEGSYPRLVNLDRPEATTATTIAEKHQYSQRKLEAVNKETRSLEQIALKQIEPKLPGWLKNALLEHDYEIERQFRERGEYRSVQFISCKGLVSRMELMQQMQELMRQIQNEYEQPVDIEFTMNLSEQGDYVINLLQCRPLQVFQDTKDVRIPEQLPPEQILLASEGASMGLSRAVRLDLIVYVDPVYYYQMPYQEKTRVAKAIGNVNWKFRNTDTHMMLIVPGRIGTSSPELGVPTAFSDISEFEVICEVAESGAGYNPELSYGSHIFQDLVEAEILYTAVFENTQTKQYHPEKLMKFDNLLGDFFPELEPLGDVIRICDVSSCGCRIYNDLTHEQLVVTL
ncbi:MAG: phosphoenolpyruvate synthase [Eubacterium sp.]|nr:phosphoenolpyruvate synthase [Eubacterium sp.]